MDTMRDRFYRVATRLLDADPRLAVVLGDIGTAGFADALERHPGRAINVGIREQLMIGVAAGLALTGFRPIAHSYTPFLVERPFEQVKLDLGHNDLGGILVSIGASYDASAEGRTHQSPEDVALLATLPEWAIHVPGHPDEVELLLRHAAAADGRVYLRLSEQANREGRAVDPGAMQVVRRGSGPTVVAVGPMLDRTLEVTEGLDVTVLYATTVLPFDGSTLKSVLQTRDIVFVEPYLQGTTAALAAEALGPVAHRSLSVGVPRIEHRHYGRAAEHDRAHRLDAAGLRDRIGAFMRAA